MEDGVPFIELRIALQEQPELFLLIRAFTAIGNQFDQFIKTHYPALQGDARLYVKEIRKGSTIVDLVPIILPLIENMDRVLIVDDFVRRYGSLLTNYFTGNRVTEISRSDINDFMGQVGVIATDPNATSTISSALYHQTKTTKRVEITFNTAEARKAQALLERQRLEIDLPAFEPHERVFMRFYQSNLRDPTIGSNRTGERVIIEVVKPLPLALIYETARAKERLKHETSMAAGNIFKKGFFVDCFVERSEGRPVAYRVTDVQEVFDLPEDNDVSKQ